MAVCVISEDIMCTYYCTIEIFTAPIVDCTAFRRLGVAVRALLQRYWALDWDPIARNNIYPTTPVQIANGLIPTMSADPNSLIGRSYKNVTEIQRCVQYAAEVLLPIYRTEARAVIMRVSWCPTVLARMIADYLFG